MPQLKIMQTTTKARCRQIKEFFFFLISWGGSRGWQGEYVSKKVSLEGKSEKRGELWGEKHLRQEHLRRKENCWVKKQSSTYGLAGMLGVGEVVKIGWHSMLPAGNLQMIFGAEQFLLPLLFLLSFELFFLVFFLKMSQYISNTSVLGIGPGIWCVLL